MHQQTQAWVSELASQGPHFRELLTNHCQIRQPNPILGVHIHNPSPEYQVSATVKVCHPLSDSIQTTQVTAVASFPHSMFSTCCSSSLSFLCHPVACSLYTVSLWCFLHSATLKYIQIPCEWLSTYLSCSKRTSAYVEWYSGQLRSAGDLPSDWNMWTTTLQLGLSEQC